ncbi:TetR/AcrR family transcriptional regulator [Anaeropeptidivorans aminofermentans]|jgi:AcrR family transcriptional regulator|uniref:TetR/AcrR family transcriptional regulator n=1 Tax=Anaeropeptidivorans aminofermentans TaxID=2934315 RepID=UPI0020244449|nr:TetR/AcrR family transcriptional regulator [Anaeropeptidivorans aminofermentans]
MSKPDRSIDPRIIESAKEEFLAHGFEKASLKVICEDAGVTTGALYKRYKGKEDLFCAVVADTVEALNNFVEKRSSAKACTLSDNTLIKAWEMGESMLPWFQFLYEHHDGFVLLISGAGGTRYANFQHDFVETMTTKTYEYFLEAKRRGLTFVDISIEEMHILLSAFWTTVYEPFIHGYTWDQIEAHCKLICDLFNWNKVLGFRPSIAKQ